MTTARLPCDVRRATDSGICKEHVMYIGNTKLWVVMKVLVVSPCTLAYR